ncbi:MAG: dihydroneopterin aldolase [Pseudomonadota bacterium]
MTPETQLAFGHPEDRARADAPDRDRISVRDLVLDTEIGAFQAERGVTQRIRFNVVVEIAPLPADLADDVDRILSYDRISEAIEAALSEERLNLLETLAERVAERILVEDQAERVFVRIEKLDRGPGTLGVEIVRFAAKDAPAVEEDAPQPVVLALGNDAMASPDLPRWLDELAAGEAPLIIAVEGGETPVPVSKATMAQRRIDLLAVEQNAWVLAGRDARCVVVDTRTELDWGMRNGQISVWAPSKMVLDAVDGPESGPRDMGGVIAWFAEQMNALEIVSAGLDIASSNTPVRAFTALEDAL